MKKLNDRIIFLLNKFLKKLNGIKFNICFDITFSKLTNEGEEVIERFSFRSPAKEITHESDIFSSIHSQNDYIRRMCDRLTVGGSGLAIEFGIIKSVFMNTDHYELQVTLNYLIG